MTLSYRYVIHEVTLGYALIEVGESVKLAAGALRSPETLAVPNADFGWLHQCYTVVQSVQCGALAELQVIRHRTLSV